MEHRGVVRPAARNREHFAARTEQRRAMEFPRFAKHRRHARAGLPAITAARMQHGRDIGIAGAEEVAQGERFVVARGWPAPRTGVDPDKIQRVVGAERLPGQHVGALSEQW